MTQIKIAYTLTDEAPLCNLLFLPIVQTFTATAGIESPLRHFFSSRI
jgi:monomeric isocitrate dehydrogenase